VNNETYLNNLAMNVKVGAMELIRREVKLRNERYLDSIGFDIPARKAMKIEPAGALHDE
jgi:hypothetical protein